MESKRNPWVQKKITKPKKNQGLKDDEDRDKEIDWLK